MGLSEAGFHSAWRSGKDQIQNKMVERYMERERELRGREAQKYEEDWTHSCWCNHRSDPVWSNGRQPYVQIKHKYFMEDKGTLNIHFTAVDMEQVHRELSQTASRFRFPPAALVASFGWWLTGRDCKYERLEWVSFLGVAGVSPHIGWGVQKSKRTLNELLLLYDGSSQLRWFRHLARRPLAYLTGEMFHEGGELGTLCISAGQRRPWTSLTGADERDWEEEWLGLPAEAAAAHNLESDQQSDDG